jgi:DNA-binding response OmpR family regulator
MSRVLIIDDDVAQSALLARLIRANGHEADCAATAGQALSRLRDQPDLVLLDLGMPRVDGLELLAALGEESRFENLRVAVYSGRAEPEAFEAARKLGACDFILKGEDGQVTLDRILAHLNAPEPVQ